jgi:hypothetical protein
MTNRSIQNAICMMALAAGLAVSQAQTASTTTPTPLSATDQWIQDAKKPADWLSWGADMRIRNEYLNNAATLSQDLPYHEQDYFRFRGRVWMTLTPLDKLDFNVRLVAEPREYMKPASGSQGSGMAWTQGIFDNMNLSYKEIGGTPLSFVVGRQDVFFGDKGNYWLVGDGTPGDGSRTYFLDSARLRYDLKDYKTTIDAVGIMQRANNDTWLPPINAMQNQYFTEQNEVGGILYVSNKSMEKTQVDAYFIYKGDTAKTAGGDTGNIYTLGTKVSGDLTDNLIYSVEGAYQFGNKSYPKWPAGPIPSESISAYGFNSRLTYKFKDTMDNQARFNFEFLSGDDPNSAQNEGFDILWGRWPRWSELMPFTTRQEQYGRTGQYQNIIRFGPGWSVTPAKNLTFSVDYNALFAPVSASTTTAPNPLFSDGDFRGHYVQAILKYKFSEHVAGHLWAEFLFPGSFYAQKEDMYTFLRAEMYFTF